MDSEVLEYKYDELNRLVHFKDAAGARTNYSYDGQNQRTPKWNEGTTTRYYWDRGYISNERGSNSWISANYVGAQGVFARETAKNAVEVTYMMKNDHGDVTALVTGGAVTKTYDYDAFGVEKNLDPADTNPFRYCAEYFDQETQNIYLRNRYYNPSNGRFLTEDPAKDGLNWYIYCYNNPVMLVDPSGLIGVMVDYSVQKNGGSVVYKTDENGVVTASVTLNGKTVTYAEDMINNHMIVDSETLAADFGGDEMDYRHIEQKDKFNTEIDAALTFGLMYNQLSISADEEYGAWILRDNEGFYTFEGVISGFTRPDGSKGFTLNSYDPGKINVSWAHTHGAGVGNGWDWFTYRNAEYDRNGNIISEWGDYIYSEDQHVAGAYLINAAGEIKYLDVLDPNLKGSGYSMHVIEPNAAVKVIATNMPN